MIYAALRKALYDDLIASLIFWWYLNGVLGSWGLDTKPYASCVMNKTVYGKQCTILWHVDDIKISHVRLKVVYRVLSQLSSKYGKVSELSTSRGQVYEHLGIWLDYRKKVKLHITMTKHIESILEAVAEDMDGIAETPLANNLFTVIEDGDTLTGTQDELLLNLVAKKYSSAAGKYLTSRRHWLSLPHNSAILKGVNTRRLPVRYVTSGQRK